MTAPSTRHPDPSSDEELSARGSSHHHGHRRVTVVAFVLSALVHLLAVAIYPLLFGPPPSGSVAVPPDVQAPRGMEVVEVAEVADAPEAELLEPTPDPDEPERPAEPAAVEPGEVPVPAVDFIGPPDRRAMSPVEELRPRKLDPRLTVPIPEDLTRPDGEWLAQLRIMWAIEELADSATAAAAAAAAANDWTYTDEDGKKWGVSPGKIHLGDLTIPMPFSFSAPYNSDAARRARIDAEIVRGAVEAATREALRERAQAIRERRNRERANRTPPDTTRGGGGGGGGGGGSRPGGR